MSITTMTRDRDEIERLRQADPLSVIATRGLMAGNVMQTAVLARLAGAEEYAAIVETLLGNISKNLDEMFEAWQPTYLQRRRAN